MSISINQKECIGCAACVEVCPGNLIKLTAEAGSNGKGRAFIRHERDCWGCTSCVKACPKMAISFYLGADIGGRGARLTVKTNANIRTWRIEKNDKSVQEIIVDSSAANKY